MADHNVRYRFGSFLIDIDRRELLLVGHYFLVTKLPILAESQNARVSDFEYVLCPYCDQLTELNWHLLLFSDTTELDKHRK
jgi:hypothetical protein